MAGSAASWSGQELTLEALRERHGERYKWLVLAVVIVGTVAAVLTSTIVNVALPSIGQSFQVGAERVQWVSSGHMAAMTVAMLVLPWALGRFGFRQVFFSAMAMLFVGSLLGGLVSNFFALIVMRLVQGSAAGLLQPLATVLILRAFPVELRGRAMGVFGFGVVLAPAVGPSLGGVLVDAFGWRAVFFVSLPIALIAFGLAWRLLPRMAPSSEQRAFDTVGFLVLTAFVVTMLETFVQLHDHGVASPIAATWVAATLALLGAWIAWERRHPAPLIDLTVFGNEAFRAGVLVGLIYGMGLFGSTLMVPAFVQHGLLYSATHAGNLLMPAGFALAVAIPLAGRLTDRFQPRWLVVIGLLLFGASFMMIAAWPEAGFAALAGMLVLGRVGLGVILPSLSLGTVQSMPLAQVPSASSVFNFARLLGGSIGTSTLAIFVEWRSRASLAAGAQPTQQQVIEAFRSGFVLLAVLFGLAAIAGWRMRPTVVVRAQSSAP